MAVVGFGDAPGVEAAVAGLCASGVAVVGEAAEASLVVAVTDDYLRDGLAELNAAALAAGRPWLLVRPGGRQCWLGPLMRPGESACWECLAQRLRGNRHVERFLGRRRGTTEPFPSPAGVVPAVTTDAVVSLVVLEVLKVLGGVTAAVDGRVVTLEWPTLERAEHVVVCRPQCPACGDPSPPAQQPVRLERQACSPGDTWASYQHHISPITGAVPRLTHARTTEMPTIHLYAAGTDPTRAWAWGADTDAAGARARALGEALEVYSGTRHGDEACRRATYRQLGDVAVHPNACRLFSARQYACRADTNPRSPRRAQIPAPLDDDAARDWTTAWSVTRQCWRYVAMVDCYYHPPDLGRRDEQTANSNGHAAGVTMAHAVLSGLLELIERDSVTLWWYNRLRRPAVDLDGLEDPSIDALRHGHDARGRDVWVLDLTTDLGVPVCVAVSARRDEDQQLLVGFGAHLDVALAARKAVTEATMIGCLTGAFRRRAMEPPTGHDHPRFWWHTARTGHALHLSEDDSARSVQVHHAPSADVHEQLGIVRQAIEAAGLELLVLDQTRPDIGLPVVQVIVPGLRYYRPPRLAPGRLYDVPVRLGWRSAPLEEDELNPVPLLL